ncbi:MAG TPA: cytochrome c biogenesis protein CcdA [Acidimicrobiales bacterium]|jgi:cytochrome c biogenesis protein CcdA
MIVAAIADGRFAYYLAAGMLATVNPCGFAMLPAYLSYFLGQDDDRDTSIARAVQVALAVSAGFLAVFAIAGTLVRVAEVQVSEYTPWISVVIGTGLLVLGVAMLAGFEPVVRLPKLERGGRTRTVRSMFVFGVSYAIASIGCTLPTFTLAVAGTIERKSFLDGVVVFLIYAAGMALVLTALTVTMALARTSMLRFLRASQQYINRIAGALVALAGAYVIFYGVLELRTYRSEGTAVPSSGITNVVTGWSYDITDWVDRTGADRIGAALLLTLAGVAGVTALRRARS